MTGVLIGTGQIDPQPPISRSVGLQKIYIGSLDMFAVMNVAADKARWPTAIGELSRTELMRTD
jgi:hypothetical protein